MRRPFFIVLLVLLAFLGRAQDVQVANEPANLRRNVLYVQNFQVIPSLVYDRQIPIRGKIGVIPSVGLGVFGDYFLPLFSVSLSYGSNKHKGDLGATYWDFEGIAIIANYRYTGNKGFFAKAGFTYIPEEEGIPTLGFGYAF